MRPREGQEVRDEERILTGSSPQTELSLHFKPSGFKVGCVHPGCGTEPTGVSEALVFIYTDIYSIVYLTHVGCHGHPLLSLSHCHSVTGSDSVLVGRRAPLLWESYAALHMRPLSQAVIVVVYVSLIKEIYRWCQPVLIDKPCKRTTGFKRFLQTKETQKMNSIKTE